TLSTLSPNPSDRQGNADPYGRMTGLAPAPINYKYADTASITVSGGSGGNTFNFNASGTTTVINTGSGNDHINVTDGGIVSVVTVNGQNGNDTFTVTGTLAGGSLTLNGGPPAFH